MAAGVAAGVAAAVMANACPAGATVATVIGSSNNAPLISALARPCWAAKTPGIRAGMGVRRTAEMTSTMKATRNCAHASHTTAANEANTT